MLEVKVINSTNYVSKALERGAKEVYKLTDSIESNSFKIAAVIASVARQAADENTDVFTADGFKNVHEWTEHAFGFKKSTSYALLKIGMNWTAERYNGKGKATTYGCNIESADFAESGKYLEFTISQVIKMLSFDETMVRDCALKGIITPEMSCRELEAKLKAVRDSLEESEPDEAEPETDETDSTEPETPESYVIVWDKDGNAFEIPASILEKYKTESAE